MTALRTLLTGMAPNSFKRLSLTSEETGLANALPRTRANFDYDFGVNGAGPNNAWANDAAVTNNPMAGVGDALHTTALLAFCGAAISDVKGRAFMVGGGHTDGGDGSIYTFDPEAGAANINASGSGTAWDLGVPSCRYIDAFTFPTQPSSGTSPEGALQAPPTTPTGINQSYWSMPNKNGVAMPLSVKTYHYLKTIPGTNKLLISGAGGFDANASPRHNACYVYDFDASAMIGPLVSASGFPSGGGELDGYVQNLTSAGCGVAMNPIDGLPYVAIGANFASRLYNWTSPTTSALVLNDTTAADGAHTVRNLSDAIVIPDPANPTQGIWFQHRAPLENDDDAHFYVVSGLNGGTPTFSIQTYASGSITTNGVVYNHYAYDPARKVIWMTDGNHLFKITPSAAGLANWTIAQITGFTGDTPADPSGSASAEIPVLQYVAVEDMLVHVQYARVLIYKPLDWSPPQVPIGVWLYRN